MAEREANRYRVADLLRAGVTPKIASETVGVSLVTVYAVKKAMNDGKRLDRKPGSGGHNKIRDPDFVAAVRAKISDDPTTSMRKMARDLEVNTMTVRKKIWVCTRMPGPQGIF